MAAAPWVRTYLGERARRLLDGATLSVAPAELASRARGLVGADPRRLLAELRGSDPLRLIASDAARETIDEVQAAMATVEGYAEHVMDAAAGDLAPNVARLRSAMDERRRARNPAIRLLLWVLGLEAKLRQYEEGKSFADAAAAQAGIAGLNRAWEGPATLPTRPELAEPSAWIARVEGAPVPA